MASGQRVQESAPPPLRSDEDDGRTPPLAGHQRVAGGDELPELIDVAAVIWMPLARQSTKGSIDLDSGSHRRDAEHVARVPPFTIAGGHRTRRRGSPSGRM